MVLDGNSIVNRAFYGVRLLSTRDGLYTNALFGFLNILQKLTNDEQPDALCVAFDRKAPTFRHLAYEGYKAKRHAMPEELAMQMPVLKEILAAMRIPTYELDGWEADDLLGTISRACEQKGWDCVIVTGDRDSLQLVTDRTTGELIADMEENGKQVTVAVGGRGGRGNPRFATNTNRAPREWEPGEPGEERELNLELKTIADVGLVGYPNAGKSTLLRAVSAARPKVAPYPFTTLHPVVGVIEYPDYSRLTVADIPGLIEGAHDNVGLGHAFLKHIERTVVLAYVLDMGGVDGRLPWDDLAHLREELELYMKGLSKRPALVVANKMDLPGAAENLELLRAELASEPIEIVPASAASGEIGELKEKLRAMVEERKKSPFDF